MPKRKTSLSPSSYRKISSEDNVAENKKSKASPSSLVLSSNMASETDLPIGAKSNASNSRKIHAAIVGNRLLYGRAKPQTTRKLVIKSARVDDDEPSSVGSASSAETYFNETMVKLENTLLAILSPGLAGGVEQTEASPYSRNISQEELYRGVENLCRYNKSKQLADLALNTIETYASMLPDVLQPYADNVQQSDNESAYYPFLRALVELWNSWSLKITLVRNIFFYLDRSYLLPPQNKLKPIWDTGVVWFSQLVLRNPQFNKILFDGVSEIVNSFRASKENQIDIIENISSMLISFKSDRPNLETAIITSAKDFCVSQLIFNPNEIEPFVKTLLSQVEIEEKLAYRLNFSDELNAKMIMNIKQLLLKSHYSEVFSGIGVLVEKSRTGEFQHIYTISNQLELRLELLAAFKNFIITKGGKILAERATKKKSVGGSSALVTTLLTFYNKCNLIVERATTSNTSNEHSTSFSSYTSPSSTKDGDYENTFRLAFAEFLNKDRSGIVPEKLAKYADELLRAGTKACSEQEFDDKLDNLILLFRCVQGKDIFEAFYKKDFAKRLLQAKSAGLDYEKSMISKFKKECGPTFTSRLETMINDMELSKGYANEFRKSSKTRKPPISFNANILTQGHWPSFPETKFNLPPNLLEYETEFTEHYLKGKDGRKLTWQRGLGHCIVKANFPKGAKELSINLIQSVVLLQFNDPDTKKLSFAEIKSLIGADDDSNLKRTLQSLACGKSKILLKQPASVDVNTTDYFSLNLDFHDKSYRIKINHITGSSASSNASNSSSTDPSSSNASSSSAQIHQQVHRDRQMEIQAAIVRIMKARKQLKHVELVQETIALIKTRGVPDVQDIKKNIEKLLEREYLERVDNTDTYTYA